MASTVLPVATRSPIHTDVVDLVRDLRPVALAIGRVIDGQPDEVHWEGRTARGRSGHPVDDSTLFRVASISKVVTTLLLLRLVERGAVELEKCVNDYLTSFQITGTGSDVTVRELLTHTSGLGLIRSHADLRMSRSFGPPAWRHSVIDPARHYRPALEISGHAGVVWSYGNHSHSVAGQVAADVTELPFAELLQAEVLDPLGMASSRIGVSRGHAVGYNQADWYGYRRVRQRRFVAAPAGELVSNLCDMVQLAQVLANHCEGFLDPIHRQLVFAPQCLRSGEEIPFAAFSFRLRHLQSELVAVHGGRYCGYSSFLIVDPERRDASVVLSTGIKLPEARMLAERIMSQGRPAHTTNRPASALHPILPTPGLYRLRTAGWIPNVHGLVATGGLIRVSVQARSFSWFSPIGAFASGGYAEPFSRIPGRFQYVKRRGRPEEVQVTTTEDGRTVIWVLPALLIFDHVGGRASLGVEALILLQRARALVRSRLGRARRKTDSLEGTPMESPLGSNAAALLDPDDL